MKGEGGRGRGGYGPLALRKCYIYMYIQKENSGNWQMTPIDGKANNLLGYSRYMNTLHLREEKNLRGIEDNLWKEI